MSIDIAAPGASAASLIAALNPLVAAGYPVVVVADAASRKSASTYVTAGVVAAAGMLVQQSDLPNVVWRWNGTSVTVDDNWTGMPTDAMAAHPGAVESSAQFALRLAALSAVPPGPIGLWLADAMVTSPRLTLPNLASRIPVSKNLLSAPRRLFANTVLWQTTATIVDAVATAPDGTTDASTLVGTGNWYLSPVSSQNIPAGTYTVSILARRKSDAVADQTFTFSTDFTVTRPSIKTATASWQTFTYTFTLGSSIPARSLCIASSNGTIGASLEICDFCLYAGSTAPASEPQLSGHITLGAGGWDTRPSFLNNAELDLATSGGYGVAQFPSPLSISAVTCFALVSKLALHQYSCMFAKAQDHTKFGQWVEYNHLLANINASIAGNGRPQEMLNKGYRVLTHRHTGTSSSVWVDDIKLFEMTDTFTATTIADLFLGVFSNVSFVGGSNVNALSIYSYGLTDAQIRQEVNALRLRATVAGLTVGSLPRLVFADGNSYAQGTVGGIATPWLTRYAANSDLPVFGPNLAVGSSTIANCVARIPTLQTYFPPDILTRKNVFVWMAGSTEMLSGIGAVPQFLIDLAAYYDSIRALGLKIALITLPPNNANPGYNAARNSANSTLVTWIGTGAGKHADYLVDVAADPTIGPDAACLDTSLYFDGSHMTQVAQDILEGLFRAAVDPVLA